MSSLEHSLDTTNSVEGKPEAMTVSSQRHSLSEGVPTVTVDLIRVDPHLVTLYDSDPHAAQEYGKLAVTLISVLARRPSKRVLITSAKHGDGRTSVTLNLAGALAAAKRRVLVVDTDLSRPSVMRLLGAEVDVGLPEGIAHGLSLSEITRKVLPFGFSLVATRSPIESPVEVLASPMFRADLEMIEPDYDFILFDSPPLLASTDAQMLRRLVDRTLLVIRPGTTTPTEMARALAMFRRKDLLGVVLNSVVSLSLGR